MSLQKHYSSVPGYRSRIGANNMMRKTDLILVIKSRRSDHLAADDAHMDRMYISKIDHLNTVIDTNADSHSMEK